MVDKQEARISHATMLDRTADRISDLISQLRGEANEDPYTINGEVDESYFEAVRVLEAARKAVDFRSKAEWDEISKNMVTSTTNIENLCNAVVEQAVLDYEKALSNGDKNTIYEVDRFAKSGDSKKFSSVDLEAILARVKREYPAFSRTVQARGGEIVADTARKRKKKETYASGPVKCPLCGNALYHSGKPVGNAYKIKCTGCNLEGWYRA